MDLDTQIPTETSSLVSFSFKDNDFMAQYTGASYPFVQEMILHHMSTGKMKC